MGVAKERVDKTYGPVTLVHAGLAAVLRISNRFDVLESETVATEDSDGESRLDSNYRLRAPFAVFRIGAGAKPV